MDYEWLLGHAEEPAIDLLKLRMVMDETDAIRIAGKFVRGFKFHGRSVTIEDAQTLWLNVEELPPSEWDLIWKFSKIWEIMALITAEAGSNILSFEIGNGVAFVPSKKAKKRRR